MNDEYKTMQLENDMLRLGCEVMHDLHTNGEIKKIPRIIRQKLDLQAVYLLTYQSELNKMEITGYDVNPDFSFKIKDYIEKIVKSLTFDLTSESALKKYLDGLNEPCFIDDFAQFLNHFKTDENSEYIETMKKLPRGEVFFIPLRNAEQEISGFLLEIKKEDEQFSRVEKLFFPDIMHSISLGMINHNLLYTDTFTKLGNLKAFNQVIKKKLDENEDLVVFAIELANLDKIVSHKGEQCGESCILHIITVIKDKMKKYTQAKLFKKSFGKFLCYIRRINNNEAVEFSHALLNSFIESIRIGGHLVNIKLNIGICVCRGEYDLDEILHNSNQALQKAKEVCKNNSNNIEQRYKFYDDALKEEIKKENIIEDALKACINANKGIYVHYQPKISVDGYIMGYEALARWDDPEYKDVKSLGKHIATINKLGLSDKLFRIIFDRVCRDALKLDGDISINMEPEQFSDILIRQNIEEILNKYDKEKLVKKLKLEILETDVVDDDNFVILHDIRSLGLKISMDDFGVGFSNLNRMITLIKNKLIDEIKIDKELIDDITEDTRFFTTLVNIGYKFQINIIIEGIEHIDQYIIIRRNFPQAVIQGYLFSRPKPIEEILESDKNKYVKKVEQIIEAYKKRYKEGSSC